jgi:hypothetical protein
MSAPDPALIARLAVLFGPRPAAVLEELAWYARAMARRQPDLAASIKAAAIRRAHPYETAVLDAEARGATGSGPPLRRRVLEDQAREAEEEAAARRAEAARLQARAAALRQAAAALAAH